MNGFLKRLRAAASALRRPPAEPFPDIVPEHVARIHAQVRPYTMTSFERVWALVEAVRHVVAAGVPGALAECGVWKGGSALAMALALRELGVADRDLYLYDTFEGMPEPGINDTTRYADDGPGTRRTCRSPGEESWRGMFAEGVYNEREVRELLVGSGYPASRIHVVKGPVEQSLPGRAPEQLALLRLDTDWYESTRHELETLYPRLAPGGVLIIDDYGHWDGCRRAVDEYFGAPGMAPVLLQRIDYTGRLAIKP